MSSIQSKFASAFLVLGFAQSALAVPIALAKVAELGCHRIERLITLKKIDASFLTNIHTMEAVTLKQTAATDPMFKATATLYPGADGTANAIDIFMDDQGKPLSFTLKPGSGSQNEPVWPTIDPVTLSENSLHYILDNWQTNANLKPFYEGLTILTLSQVTNAGQTQSKAEIHSSATNQVLEVFLGTDGTFQSFTIQ